MPTPEDITRLRQTTSDTVLYDYLSKQDAGFKTSVDRVKSANPQMGVLEEAKFPSAMIDLYYKVPRQKNASPLTTQMATATAETTRQPEQEMSLGGFVQNTFKSGADFLGGITNAVMHPVQTAQNVGKLALGGAINTAETITGNEDMFDNPLGSEDVAKSVGDFYVDRYGGLENLRKTMYEDPIGFLADVSTVLTAGGGALKGVGKLGQLATAASTAGKASVPLTGAAATAGKLSGGLVKAGGAVQAASPGALLGKAGGAITEQAGKMSSRIINSLIKPAAKEFRFGKNPGQAIVSENIIATSIDDLAGKVDAKLSTLGRDIRSTIQTASSKKPPQTNISEIIDEAFKAPMKEAAKLATSEPGKLEYLRNLHQDLLRQYGGTHVPLGVFDAKVGVQGMIKFDVADPFAGTRNQALWELFERLKKANNNNVPGLRALNERFSELAAAKASIERRAAVLQRSNMIGLTPTQAGIGTAVLTGDPLSALGAAGVTKAAGSTLGKTTAAQGLRVAEPVTKAAGKALTTGSKTSRVNNALE